jgi:hypothetical protein
MAASAIVIASTFRRTRVSPAAAGEDDIDDGRIWAPEIGVNGRFSFS